MDLRIYYIILTAVVASHADPCSVNLGNACTYTVTCMNSLDANLDWTRFTNSHHTLIYADEICQQVIQYGGYRVYPVKLIFKQTFKDGTSAVPKLLNNWGNGNILNVVHELDLSEDDYTETPRIRTMQNLAKLNISRNQLTTAVLSNSVELAMLTEIDLSHNTISDIQVNTNAYVYKKLIKIDLSHNYLVKIPDAVFDEFDNLQTLDLSYNYIDTLSQFTFEGVKKLIDLNLSYNRITSINSSFFRFVELKILNLRGNRIQDITLTDFEQLRKLETLDLSSNNIEAINYNLFNTMILLQNLYLSNNQLAVVNNNAFAGLQSLTSIDLSKNKFKSLPKSLFRNRTISTFAIEDNKLEGPLERGMFEGINVTKLDLSKQFLTDVKDYAFYGLIRLDTLLLNSNSIHSLSKMCFETLINLHKLDLSNNKISDIDFSKESLNNLRSLMLKNNYLTNINHEQLQRLNSLEFLDLSENRISALEPNSFQSLKNLINLRINSNPLVDTLVTGTFDGLVLLPSLDISGNMLATIQNASFTDMSQLKELNLSHCEISELQYNTFIHTGYIETLDLSYNKLESFSVNTTDLVSLLTLSLNNNLIKTISSSSLHGLSRLYVISLSHNFIEHIDNESFSTLLDLRTINLSFNKKINFSMQIIDKNKNLNTLILSGVEMPINFSHVESDNPISSLSICNASIQNISALHLNKVTHLNSLEMSYNNISKLQIGDFTGLSSLRHLDLSFNHITYIQPGVFKDNTVLHLLNISHNSLSSVGYGIFRGLIYLSILDVSYNNIKDLESERFYEVKCLSEIIADHNKIDSLNAEEFVGTSLTKLSIGDNPLPCQILVKLRKTGVPFEITAIKIDEHSNENVNGVSCNKEHRFEAPDRVGNHSDIFNGLQNILHNFTNKNADRVNTEYLEKISNVLEKSNSIYDDKLSALTNLTAEVIAINNNTNILISKIMKSLLHPVIVSSTSTLAPDVGTVRPTTTLIPLLDNTPNVNQSTDIISYINKIKKEMDNALIVQKQNIMSEIESKLATNNYHTETLPTDIGHEQLISYKESPNSYFTEICVALILMILVGLVLYKFYKSRMFVRNRFSLSTRELPGSMENSAL